MNIILIVSDTFRYDHLGYNGNDWIRTPELDALAARSVCFDNCYHGSFPTMPHRCDMVTGRYSFTRHGWAPLGKGETAIAEVLRANGYVCQLIADTPHLMKHDFNYSRGCHGYYWTRGQEGDTWFTRMNQDIRTTMPRKKTRCKPIIFGHTLSDIHAWTNTEHAWEEDTFAAQTCRMACKWLELNYKTPEFFLWIDCFDVHEPWDPPEYLVDLYDPGYKGAPMTHPNYDDTSVYTKAELKNLRAHYAAEVTLVSKWIGRVLRKVEDLGLLDDTAIVFTSDHGMSLGEHRLAGKHYVEPKPGNAYFPLYRPITHVPLLVYAPGVSSGARRTQLAQPADIAPTLLDLAGIAAPELTEGHSLAPLLKGRAPRRWPRKVAVSSRELRPGVCPPQSAVTDGGWSLVFTAPNKRPRLHDLRVDPGENRNVFSKHPQQARRLMKGYLELVERVGTAEEKAGVVRKAMELI